MKHKEIFQTVASSSLGLTVSGDKQCHYLQNFKYIDNLYSVQQVIAVSMCKFWYKHLISEQTHNTEYQDT